MLRSFIIVSIMGSCLLADAPAKDDNWRPTPVMRTVTPDTAKTGDKLTVAGQALDKANVAEVYLTKGEDNYKLEILSQTATQVVVKVPAGVKEGRLRLMVLTTGLEPQFLEQPVAVDIK